MRPLLLLGMMFITGLTAVDAEAQQRFFTLSGGSRGDAANAKHESQISELQSVLNAKGKCAADGFIYGKSNTGTRHAKSNDTGCISTFQIDQEGNVAITGDALVSGDVIINGQAVQQHALSDAPTCDADQKLTWSGNDWRCIDETDPSVGALVSGKWCAESGGKIVCNQDKPSSDLELDVAIDDAILNNVRDFARKGGALASCGGGEVLIADGSTLKCLSLDSIAAGTLILDDMSDVNVGLPSMEDILYFNGTSWVAGQLVEEFAKASIDNLNTSNRCAIGDVITFDGDQLTCIPDIGGPNDALVLEDMADVSGTTDATATNIMYFDGQYWKADAERDLTVSDWAKITNPIANQVSNQCDVGYNLTYNGTTLECVADAGGAADPFSLGDMTDVSLTAPANDEVLKYVGGTWVNAAETDPNIQAFARNANPLPNCPVDHILTADGTNLSCTADAGSAANGIAFNDLTDVSITTPANHDLVVYNGSGFVNKGSAVCAADELLTYDGTSFSCVKATDIGLWTDNTTFINRDSAYVINDAQALPAAITGAGTRTLWYPSKGAFRAGTVTGTQWDDANIGQDSVAFGLDIISQGANAFAAGENLTVTGDNSLAFGEAIQVDGANSVGVGLDATAYTVTNNNTMAIMGGQVGVGTVTPASEMEVSGTLTATYFVGDGNGITNINTSAITFGIDDLTDGTYDGSSVFLGNGTGTNDDGANNNVAVGKNVLTANVDGTYNTAIGNTAMNGNVDGGSNIAMGAFSLQHNESGNNNVALGVNAGLGVASSSNVSNNVFLGRNAGSAIETGGDDNTFLGYRAGDATTSGARNIIIGSGVDASAATASDELNIGNLIVGDMAGNSLTVTGDLNNAGDFNTTGNIVAGGTLNTGGDAEISGTLTVLGALNVSGTQTIDGVVFAGGGIEATGNISATTFTGDGSGITGVTAASADWYDITGIPTGVVDISNTALTPAELAELQNIDAVTITNTQWGYVGNMNQGVNTADDVTFASVTATDISATNKMSVGDDLEVGDRLTVENDSVFNGGANAIAMTAGASSDHAYMTIYADSDNISTRSGYLGYGSTGTSHLTLSNEMTGGDLVLDADNRVVLSANVSATGVVEALGGFVGDGSGLTNVIASGADWYDITSIPTGVVDISNTALTPAELGELQNIDAVTITNTQWGYVGNMNQGVNTVDDVTFNNITATANVDAVSATLTGDLNVAGATSLATLDTSGDAIVGGTLTVVGALNVSGTQTIDGVIFANNGVTASGTISATSFVGDGSGITGVSADDANTLDGLDSLQFLRSDQDDVMVGNLEIDGNLDVTGTVNVHHANGGGVIASASDGAIQINSGDDAAAYIDFTGSANLASDYEGRIIHTDGTGFGFLTTAGSKPMTFDGNELKITNSAVHTGMDPNVGFKIDTDGYSGGGWARGLVAYDVATRNAGAGFLGSGTTVGSYHIGFGSDWWSSDSAFTVLSNGNVGIGKVTPTATLDVSGSAVISGNLTVSDPTIAGHAATKNYVDNQLGALSQNIITEQDTSATITDSGVGEFTVDVDGNRTVTVTDGKVNIAGTGVNAATHAALDVSGTLKVAGTGAEACTGDDHGAIRFNPGTGRLQYCRP